jgi:hypothetical protein
LAIKSESRIIRHTGTTTCAMKRNDGMGEIPSDSIREPVCAMKLSDEMGGNPYWPYQEVSKPLGLSVAGRSAG